MIYAVIDTNVIVSSLLTRNHDSATARVMNAVYEGKVIPLVCDEILGEYEEVLHRAQLKLDPAKCDYILSLIRDQAEPMHPVHTDASMPDEDDRIFFEIALAGQDVFDSRLVTGNIKDYPKADFVVSPSEFCIQFDL
ncbi:MAG: putative toxin-antitoxin system toxin component, PIN family [Kiritimatiellae bacterium]|jgi:putative PIN family toxin of toxin-antitoxin system|nr:putative toxin-antitoxin system toxin component, PIN family [Kiritimatiellia bacterium]